MLTELLVWLLVGLVFLGCFLIKAIEGLRVSREQIAETDREHAETRNAEMIAQLSKIVDALEAVEMRVMNLETAPKVEEWDCQ